MRFIKYIGCTLFFSGVLYITYKFLLCDVRVKYINSYTHILDTLNAVDSTTLVLFDVDKTLIVPRSKVFWSNVEQAHIVWIQQLFSALERRAKKPLDFYFSIWLKQEIPVLIEPSIVDIIRKMQHRGVTVLALTMTDTGPHFVIPSLPEWRFAKLKEVGIDFSRADVVNVEFTELSTQEGHHPVLYNGIVCCGSVPKSKVLGALLDRMQRKPAQIIFFDDKVQEVESVLQEACRRSIPFSGYCYQGADAMVGDLDKTVTHEQFNYLVDNEEWLDEDQVRAKKD